MSEDRFPGELMMQLGQLIESTRTLGRDIQEIKQTQVYNATRAEKDREGIRAEMEHVGNRIDALETQVTGVTVAQKEMREVQNSMKLVTDKVTRWQWAGGGAIAVTSIAFAAIGWLISHFWDRIFGP